VADKGSNFTLESWIAQLRFEAQAEIGVVQAMLYWFLLVLLFYQVTFTFQFSGVIVMPVQALVVAFVVFFFVLVLMADDVRARYVIVREYRLLLAEVFLSGLPPDKISERYRAIKSRGTKKLGWWRRVLRQSYGK